MKSMVQARVGLGVRRGVSRERWLVALVLGIDVAGGLAVQRWIPPGPATVVGAAAVVAAAAGVSLFVGRALRDAVSSFGFIAAAVTMLLAATVWGTVAAQGHPSPFFLEHHPHIARAIFALGLADVFGSAWFGGLVGLLIAALASSASRYWPPSVRNAGVLAGHAGMLVALGGAGLSGLHAVRGRLDLQVGAPPADQLRVTRHGRPTGQVVTLPFAVSLERVGVQRAASEYCLATYDIQSDGSPLLRATFAPESPARHRLPHGAWFRVKGYYPDLVYRDRIVAARTKGGVPALALRIDGRELWLPAGGATESDDGKILLRFDWDRVDGTFNGGHHRVAENGQAPVRLQIGDTRVLPSGRQITALRFFAHFQYDPIAHVPENPEDGPDNPALEVELAPPHGRPLRLWLFAHVPGMEADDGGPPLDYLYDAQGRPPRLTVLVSGAEHSVTLVRDGERLRLEWADVLDLAGGRLRLGHVLANAVRIREPASASAQPRNPAVLVELHDAGDTHERMLLAAERDGIGFGVSDVLALERRNEDLPARRAEVTIAGRHATLSVGETLTVGAWTLLQSDPEFSTVEVVHDPGAWWVLLGLALVGLGVAYSFYGERPTRGSEG